MNGTDNGLYEKAPPNSMPGNGFNNSNYWVDVSFFDANISAIQPSVVYTNPVNGSTGVDVNGDISVTFNKDIDGTTISNSTFFLMDPSNNLIPATVSYTSSSRTAKLIPNASLNYSETYTVTVKSGSLALRRNRSARRPLPRLARVSGPDRVASARAAQVRGENRLESSQRCPRKLKHRRSRQIPPQRQPTPASSPPPSMPPRAASFRKFQPLRPKQSRVSWRKPAKRKNPGPRNPSASAAAT